MNFAACHVNAWSSAARDSGEPVDSGEAGSLIAWLENHRPHWARPNAYVPRALVGEYLHDCFRKVVRTMPAGVDLKIVSEAVLDIVRSGSRWRVVPRHGVPQDVDDVLVTVGHEGWRSAGGRSAPTPASIPIVEHVYPVARQLTEDRVPAGTQVAVQGFALTWIDATLALTEGRGGRFLPDGAGWKYLPSGREPAAIAPFSRTGRPLLAKPESHRIGPDEQLLNPVWRVHRSRLERMAESSSGSLEFERQILPMVLDAADDALRVVRDTMGSAAPKFQDISRQVSAARSAREWFDRWCGTPSTGHTALRAMQQAYAVAVGIRPHDFGWAVGESWRQLYSTIVAIVSYGGLAVGSWPSFWRGASELERIAFGPPAENLGRMLALVDCGLLRLQFVADAPGPGRTVLEASGGRFEPDVVINAVLPSPRQLADDGPLAKLLARGVLRRLPGGEGIAVGRDAVPLCKSGQPVNGLAILGRPTEGCVLGNDSLSRQLHLQPSRWAASFASRLQETGAPS